MDKIVLPMIFILTATLMDMLYCMPTYWCPVGRYPDENGQCNLCYENCGADGCTGPGSHLGFGGCNSCWLGLEHHHHRVTCMSPFTTVCPEGHYRKRSHHNGQSLTMCKRCHPLCRSCDGPGISSCETCRLYRWDGICISVCPVGSVMRGGRHRTCVVPGGHYGRGSSAFYLLPYRDRNRHSP
ncbi:receptor tyrosine-protein kinase let-23-like [Mercenaria mercenaria]|uniref:receptor tyrosine-protein kinase let-23-like n=1 Tax=Mercenaria mercenaria TaxID=6596 RepID=UPI00234F7C92|nr:receptor tyrosine-protein kinase let-23-like [Mercenaria mercenaria]